MASISSTISLLLRYIGLLNGKTVHTTGDETIAGTKNFSGTLQAGGYTAEAVVESGDGYIRYSSGLQICWGTAPLNGPITSTNKKVTYPKPFAANKNHVVLTTLNANVGLDIPVGVGWESDSHFMIGTSGAAATGHTTWIAIGWWK